MKKNATLIIVIGIIVIGFIVMLLTLPKTTVPEGIAPESEGQEIPGQETEGIIPETGEDPLKGAEAVIPGASPVSEQGQVLTLEGKLADNAALPGSPQAPKQSRVLTEQEIPESAVKLVVSAKGFEPKEFTVKTGKVVTLSIISGDKKIHSLAFDDLILQAVAISATANETVAITFNAPAPGDYAFYCGTPAHRDRGETGVMHVK